jgi:hypothetical protein
MEIFHEIDRGQDRGVCADLGDVLFDLVLAIEVRNARLPVGGTGRTEDKMYACGLRRICGGDALSRLGSCASLQGRRHRKEGARSFERLRERCRVFERRADECDARGCELPRRRGLGIARDGANLMTALEQAFHHSATLFARASGDDDGNGLQPAYGDLRLDLLRRVLPDRR